MFTLSEYFEYREFTRWKVFTKFYNLWIIGTPNMRRGFIHNESPLATPKSSKAGMNDESTNEPMDEWELKLLGKKGGE